MTEREKSFAHELKNLLAIMIGYSEMLLDEMPADDPHRADVAEMKKAADSALALVDRSAAPTWPTEGG